MTSRLPTFLVIGAQKSATTTLINSLGTHPDVFALPREVHFFDRFHDRGLDWYRERFAKAHGQRAVGESTPEYLYQPHARERIARDLPGVLLIAILRDPVERAYSHYWHNRTRGHEALDFDAAIAQESRRLVETRDTEQQERFAYLDRGLYLRQLEAVAELVPRDHLHVVLTDDLRASRVAALRGIFRFLGVEEGVTVPEVRDSNRFITYRSQRLRPLIRRLPGPLRSVAGRLNFRYDRYPPMDPETEAFLRERFAPDNRALAEWLGRELSWERRKPPEAQRPRGATAI
jgi:hypothetical protein